MFLRLLQQNDLPANANLDATFNFGPGYALNSNSLLHSMSTPIPFSIVVTIPSLKSASRLDFNSNAATKVTSSDLNALEFSVCFQRVCPSWQCYNDKKAWLYHESGLTRQVRYHRYHTLTEYRQEVTAFAIAFRPESEYFGGPLPSPSPHSFFITLHHISYSYLRTDADPGWFMRIMTSLD
ncbi:hypothetical protein EVAR_46820_1 [Eumeta japonica]|uniref:Uncharacterized protein n=1 Tax=Eumeta variegata TaxID=151549 RepID=A0A4C1ZSW3_EUMVA|nr:hypothetical protein EVAR_46820_1 [Eumeta japonica]